MILDFQPLNRKIEKISASTRIGFVTKIGTDSIEAKGLSFHARAGDQVEIHVQAKGKIFGEVIALTKNQVVIMPFSEQFAPAIDDKVILLGEMKISPSPMWTGRIVDAFGQPLDGLPLMPGDSAATLKRSPPDATRRRALGSRLNTGMMVFDTFLPIARGQRIGIFAGSGVGKTSLLAELAQHLEADCVVIGLIGERGRELRDFVENVLGEDGMRRSIIVVATSDQSAILKRRAAWTATSIAEVLRDIGLHVLLIIDSLTRFAEAHREIALTSGETPSLRAYPPSTANALSALTERAGPGESNQGDITAVYSVLVAGSDMEEPISDIVRGILDGHVILDRGIAERGRFPAIDISKSVSRSLPQIASNEENAILSNARRVISTYEKSEILIQTGLYVAGTDTQIDEALRIWPIIDSLVTKNELPDAQFSFDLLKSAFESEP